MTATTEDIDEALKTVALLHLPVALEFQGMGSLNRAIGRVQERCFPFEAEIDSMRSKYRLVIKTR